jgi:hypothetical protein
MATIFSNLRIWPSSIFSYILAFTDMSYPWSWRKRCPNSANRFDQELRMRDSIEERQDLSGDGLTD